MMTDLDSMIYLVSIPRTHTVSIIKRRSNTHSFILARHCQYYLNKNKKELINNSFFLEMDQVPLGDLKTHSCRTMKRVLHLPPQINEVYSFERGWLIVLPFFRDHFEHNQSNMSSTIIIIHHRYFHRYSFLSLSKRQFGYVWYSDCDYILFIHLSLFIFDRIVWFF